MRFTLLLFLLTPLLPATELDAQGQALSFEPGPGDYPRGQEVRISGGDAGAVYYTLDGSRPSPRSRRYVGTPVTLEHTAVLRAAVFDGFTQSGPETGGSYLIDEPASELLTVSVGIDPWRLFNPVSGWFMPGPDPGTSVWDPTGANWWTRKEFPCHVDLLLPDGTPVHNGMLGLRMFGGLSRTFPQKSFSLSGREAYGNKKIDYPLFGPEGNKDFRFLVVRNGGSDWGRSYVRDALLTSLLRDESWDLDLQDARPVRVYLNGKYWGLYHLREKINPRFLADHHDVDKDSLSLLEHELTVKHGSSRAYERLRDFVQNTDLTVPENYARLAELMDIDNFQRLQIAQTYFDNRDAGGNIRYWRPDGPDGRFRWILYDVDQGFGLHREEGWKTNTLAFYTDAHGPSWPNPPWSTLFQRRLLTNAHYRRTFVNRTLDYLHTDFSAEAVAERTEAAIASVAQEMPRQLTRWQQDRDHWDYHTDKLRQFAAKRPAFLREHLRDYFAGGEDRAVDLVAGRGGYVILNANLQVASDGLTGTYFANVPLSLEAVAEPGYHFTGWEGTVPGTSPRLEVHLSAKRDYSIRATFAPATHPLAGEIIINEICPRSTDGGDWLEIHNRGTVAAPIGGWYLTDDSGRRFELPATTLQAGTYLVVCREEEKFRATYPDVPDFVAGLPFGLNKEDDRIGLYSHDGSYVNAVAYQLPPRPDSSFTYALALPGLDNSNRRNWVVESGRGTPGAANPAHLQSAVITRQHFWTRIGVGIAVLLVVGVVRSLHLRPRP
ncbi:CotH kinase family protein [Lewinella sp. JB7]|uniref:CotH kinase family protein n=1 Tax=Lewinella sp. JB7 TaxID=2962887 RepID=UPI0020C95BA7|nr:CotH kinase family protein [Lewinella sp. JB7]MCP9234516.1 CotH kinase family protein [Lewinella sp. JB7]